MLDGLAEYGYWGLLLASFLAATILPFSSEVVFAALIAAGMDIWTSILYATAGNAAGGATCYYLGRLGKMEWLEKWFKIKPDKIDKTIRWMHGKGAVMGFFVLRVRVDQLQQSIGECLSYKQGKGARLISKELNIPKTTVQRYRQACTSQCLPAER